MTTAVRAAHVFDENVLRNYLTTHGVMNTSEGLAVEQFSNGFDFESHTRSAHVPHEYLACYRLCRCTGSAHRRVGSRIPRSF
jgi:hypothetical protein